MIYFYYFLLSVCDEGYFFCFGTHWSKNIYIISIFKVYFEVEAFVWQSFIKSVWLQCLLKKNCIVLFHLVTFFAVKCVI